jgi:hypothetical protein
MPETRTIGKTILEAPVSMRCILHGSSDFEAKPSYCATHPRACIGAGGCHAVSIRA